MHVARCLCESKLTALEQMFGNCPQAVEKVREVVGDSGELLDFWFDFAPHDRHAVFFRYRDGSVTHTEIATLER
ncbi:MAG: hypothetical protein IPN69_08415 [Acidobacteria bacterium]|nr:hypothetical protein [Acidobacteriota bacterium]